VRTRRSPLTRIVVGFDRHWGSPSIREDKNRGKTNKGFTSEKIFGGGRKTRSTRGDYKSKKGKKSEKRTHPKTDSTGWKQREKTKRRKTRKKG